MTIVVARPVDPVEQADDLETDARVEVPGGLVGEEDRRLVDDGASDRDALLLAAGELVREPLLLTLESDDPQRLGDGLADHRAGLADDLQREGDVLEDGLVGQQPEVLEHRADLATQLALCGRAAGRAHGRDEHRAGGGVLLFEREPRRVDLPEPDWPTMKTNSPRSTSRDTPSTAGRVVRGYFFVTVSNKIIERVPSALGGNPHGPLGGCRGCERPWERKPGTRETGVTGVTGRGGHVPCCAGLGGTGRDTVSRLSTRRKMFPGMWP